jgi:uncharacterized membrane protein
MIFVPKFSYLIKVYLFLFIISMRIGIMQPYCYRTSFSNKHKKGRQMIFVLSFINQSILSNLFSILTTCSKILNFNLKFKNVTRSISRFLNKIFRHSNFSENYYLNLFILINSQHQISFTV